MTTILLIGLASGVAALAIAEGRIFEPLRAHLHGWIGELVGCVLCLGVWLCAALWLAQGLPDGVSPPVALGSSWAVSVATSYGLERLASS